MLIKDFLDKFIEGYLFKDLASMENISIPSGQTYGAAAYPMMISILAGMELLGYLLMPDEDPFDYRKGNFYFENYWDNYLTREEVKYTGLANLFRNLVRHGIAHSFLTKHGVFVSRGTDDKITINAANEELYVDADVFYHEFKDSYEHFIRPIIYGPAKNLTTTADGMQRKLDALGLIYEANSKSSFAGLSHNDLTPPMRAGGASGTSPSGYTGYRP